MTLWENSLMSKCEYSNMKTHGNISLHDYCIFKLYYRQNRKYNAMKNAFEILYVHNGYMTSLTLDCFPLNRDTDSLKM